MQEAKVRRPFTFVAAGLVAVVLVAALAGVSASADAPSAAASVAAGRVAAQAPADGFYFVNDDFKFTIAHKYGVTLMRFAGDDEVFVLSVERGPVGSRILKYDTGDVALQVTGYGGVTLYTSTAPGGLPADRMGGGEAIAFPIPSMSMVRARAQHLANLLEQVSDLKVAVDADWSRIDDGPARYLTLDAMRIATRALRGVCANRANRAQLLARLRKVHIARGDRPAVALKSGILTMTIAPVYGLSGRMSSLAVARAIRAQLGR
jgi:hypothetical protein